MTNIPLTETWTKPIWRNWSTSLPYSNQNSLGQNATAQYPIGITEQQHINIRNFSANEVWGSPSLFAPSSTLLPSSSIYPGMTPSGTMVTGSLSGFNYWNAATVTTPSAGSYTFANTSDPIDLTQIGDGTILSIALPSFPLSSIDLNHSSLSLSDSSGNSVNLPWSSSLATPVNGNSQLSWSFGMLTGIDLTSVATVGLTITTTAACTFYFMALRLLADGWTATNVDFNTISNQLEVCIPANGDPTFVASSQQTIPTLWRSALPAGINDPRPVDVEMGAMIYTGHSSQPQSFTFFLRGLDQVFSTQIDLEGMTQNQLAAQSGQPMFTTAPKAPRTMGELETLEIGRLDGESMFDIETTDNPINTSYVSFTLNWGGSTSIEIANARHPNVYTWSNLSLSSQTWYLLSCEVADGVARLIVYTVDQTTHAITGTLFDTGTLPDSGVFSRYQGRIGFLTNLSEDATVADLRPRHVVFAEYRSAPLQSITPVQGAQLFVSQTPDMSFWNSWSPFADSSGNTPILKADANHSLSGDSTAVEIGAISGTLQGIISNPLLLTDPDEANEQGETIDDDDDPYTGIIDFNETQISFDLWIPDNAFTTSQPITFALTNSQGAVINLQPPQLISDEWQHIELLPPYSNQPLQSGVYQLTAYYHGPANITWWIDNPSVIEHVVSWSGRSIVDDPWQSNDAPWTDFRDLLNNASEGIRFNPPGKELQVRGRALKQDATIANGPKIIPKYAQLGKLVWPEDSEQFTTTTTISTVHGTPTSASDNTSTGSVVWASPSNALVSDGVYSTAIFGGLTTSHYLAITGFNFSLPTDAIIKGITITAKFKGDQVNTSAFVPGVGAELVLYGVQANAIRLIKGGLIQTQSKAVGGAVIWPRSPVTYTYGTTTDLWNNQWTAANINSPNFGVGFSLKEVVIAFITGQVLNNTGVAGHSGITAYIDSVTMGVTYTSSTTIVSGQIQAPTAVPIITNTSGRTYTFDGSASQGSSPIGNWVWDAGDGNSITGKSVHYTYNAPGTYYVTLTVTDRYGLINIATNQVTVT